jgi:tetratricopeptide (TPR) repeat protein
MAAIFQPLIPILALVASTVLSQGAAVDREISGGEVHRYRIELEAASALEVHVDQIGVDVVVDVESPSGTRVASVDGHTGAWGVETVFLVAHEAGPWTLSVHPLAPDGRGRTRTEVVLLRRATSADRERVAAREALARAWKSRSEFRYEDARRDGEAALETLNRAPQADVPEKTDALELLGYVYDEIGLFDRGADAFREVVERRRQSGSPRAAVLEMESNLAWLELGGGHYADAARRFGHVVEERRALAKTQALLPNGSLMGLGNALARLGRLDEAVTAFRSAVADYEAGPPSRRPDSAGALSELGRVFLRQGRLDDAESSCRRALELRHASGWGDLGRSSDLRCLGAVDAARKRWEEGEKKLGEALDLCKGRRGMQSLCAADSLEELGRLLSAREKPDEARERFADALRIKTAILPRTHPEVQELERELGPPR